MMITKHLRACVLPLAAGGLILMAGCVVEPGRVYVRPAVFVPPPPVVIAPPPPVYVAPPPVVVAEPVMVPESYVWDGYEYVGVVGDRYLYLGPGNIWIGFEPWRLERFHGWERGHADWRGRAIRNDRFRRDHEGHEHPRREPERR